MQREFNNFRYIVVIFFLSSLKEPIVLSLVPVNLLLEMAQTLCYSGVEAHVADVEAPVAQPRNDLYHSD